MPTTAELVLSHVRSQLAGDDLEKDAAVFGSLARGAQKLFGKGRVTKFLRGRQAAMSRGGGTAKGLLKQEAAKSEVVGAARTAKGAGKALTGKWGRRALVGGGLIGLGAAGVGAASAANQMARAPHAPPTAYPPGY